MWFFFTFVCVNVSKIHPRMTEGHKIMCSPLFNCRPLRNHLLIYVVLSCLNKIGQCDPAFQGEAEKEITSIIGWESCVFIGKFDWNLPLPKWDLRASFLHRWFRDSGLCWRFAHAEKTSSIYSLWCGDTQSGLAWHCCGGVNPQSLCQVGEEAENMTNMYMIYSSLSV